MRSTILLFMMSVALISLNAQNSYETREKWEKAQAPGVAIKVNVSPDDAIKALESLLKKEGLSGKKSGKTLKYEKTVFTTISTDYINLYAKAELVNKSKENPVSVVYIFISKGVSNDFVSSEQDRDLIANLMSLLDTKYTVLIQETYLSNKIAAKNKEIEGVHKSISDLEKSISKKKDDIVKNEKQIEKSKEAIVTNNKDIEKALKDIETQRELLKVKEKELSEIK